MEKPNKKDTSMKPLSENQKLVALLKAKRRLDKEREEEKQRKEDLFRNALGERMKVKKK